MLSSFLQIGREQREVQTFYANVHTRFFYHLLQRFKRGLVVSQKLLIINSNPREDQNWEAGLIVAYGDYVIFLKGWNETYWLANDPVTYDLSLAYIFQDQPFAHKILTIVFYGDYADFLQRINSSQFIDILRVQAIKVLDHLSLNATLTWFARSRNARVANDKGA